MLPAPPPEPRHMDQIDNVWLEQFDQMMLAFYAIDHADAGMDEALLLTYSDLEPREAALVYGEDYDLHLLDAMWPPVRSQQCTHSHRPSTNRSISVTLRSRSRLSASVRWDFIKNSS